MTFSKIGRLVAALVATAALGLGMTACGGGTIGYMWVLGTFYNQISGFKIDDYTGNLTAINHSPFSSGGTNPVSVVVKPGGRYIYVINAGTGAVGVPNTTGYVGPTGANISQFAVGGDGILTFQQNFFSQGFNPVWASIDTSGNYLYVVDKYSPYYNGSSDQNGSITVFSIASDTGRLTLVPNTQILKPGTQIPTTVFEVGPNPIMAKTGLGGCLFTLSPNSIYPYSINSSNGQLTQTATGPYAVSGSVQLSSINTGLNTSASNFIYLTDYAANMIFSLQAGGTTCSLAPVSGSQQTNLPGTAHPANSLTSQSGKYLYVLNQSSTSTTTNSNSSISAFQINTLGQLQQLADSTNNPYSVGSGPVCIVQDPTNQYLYISNNTDSTLTGKLIDQNRGFLSNLSRGSVFPTTKNPTCLAVSGNI
jgi:6-phosphogluconolactonase